MPLITQRYKSNDQFRWAKNGRAPCFGLASGVRLCQNALAKLLILNIGALRSMAGNKEDKPKKFFGCEVSDTISYVIVVVLAIIFVRQVMTLF